ERAWRDGGEREASPRRTASIRRRRGKAGPVDPVRNDRDSVRNARVVGPNFGGDTWGHGDDAAETAWPQTRALTEARQRPSKTRVRSEHASVAARGRCSGLAAKRTVAEMDRDEIDPVQDDRTRRLDDPAPVVAGH